MHIRSVPGVGNCLVGHSVADSDGYLTRERPPEPNPWRYCDAFYRVLLRDYLTFPAPIGIDGIFTCQKEALIRYRETNRQAYPSKRLFYAVSAGKLKYQQGAYLSEADDELAGILLGPSYQEDPAAHRDPLMFTDTTRAVRELRRRVKVKLVSDQIKANYGSRCCFPECPVSEDRFLVAQPIASVEPWEIRDGLCLCLMHARAFTEGMFTLSQNLRVLVDRHRIRCPGSNWSQASLVPYDGREIRGGKLRPSEEALSCHSMREARPCYLESLS